MKKLLDKIGHRGIALGAIFILSALFYILPISTNLELSLYDFRLSLLRGGEIKNNIFVAAIDQQSLDELGGFPWKRSRYAEFLKTLKKKRPKMVVFDILFQEPKPEDEELARAVEDSGFPVVFPYNYVTVGQLYAGEQYKKADVTEKLKKSAAATGFIDISPDPDRVMRRIQLAIKYEGKYEPSMDLAAFALWKGVKPEDIRYEKNRIIVGDSVIPTDDNYYMLIDYYIPEQSGSFKQSFPVQSFSKYLSPDNTADLNDVILLVGIGTIGMQDDFRVPNNPNMYGSVIHANVLNTLMRESYIRTLPEYWNLLVILAIILVYGLVLSRTANVKKLILASVFLFVGYSILNFFLFKMGVWLDWVQPVFVIFSGTLVVSIMQFFRTHKIFGQFVAKEVVDKMVESDKFTEMGGVEKEVSILFSDIRGYTTLSEKMSPSAVMNMLNEYHAEMVKIFQNHYGRVFDYQGDAQMVVFGAPVERDDHALCACKAALDMEIALEKLREKWKLENRELFEIGVGICTGVVAIGLVGAEGHKQYSAIGDSTNVAARLQGKSKELNAPIIISEKTNEYVKDILKTRSLGETELKGKSKPMEVFTVLVEEEKSI